VNINRHRVGREFHRQACEYDQHAVVQQRVVSRLAGLVQHHVSLAPEMALDIGCGTGRLLSCLGGMFPLMRLAGLDLAYNMASCAAERLGPACMVVNGDAGQLPFKNHAFDLVVSTSTLQWIEDLDVFFRQCHRVLQPGGTLCIAFFAGRTMWELQECYRDALQVRHGDTHAYLDRLHRFKDVTEVREALGRSCFRTVSFNSETEMDSYAGVHDLLRSVKRIGAGSAAQESRRGGLGWRRILNETSRLYSERYATDGMIPVTYEVFYIIARA
jgi:malonyl-CoA O-methyltransferase